MSVCIINIWIVNLCVHIPFRYWISRYYIYHLCTYMMMLLNLRVELQEHCNFCVTYLHLQTILYLQEYVYCLHKMPDEQFTYLYKYFQTKL